MAHSLVMPLRSLLINGTHRFATCWKIVRVDTTTFRFTDHDKELVVNGETYTPAGGFLASARLFSEGVAAKNFEVNGVLTSDAITEEDLRLGLFRDAVVTETLVDWKYPWAGSYYATTYYLQTTTFDREVWKAELAGLPIRLASSIGNLYERTCRWTLGDSNCTKNIAVLTVTGTVAALVTSRHRFTSNLTGADNYFNDALVTWVTGDNAGFTNECKKFLQTSGDVELQIGTPFEIQSGDTFTVYPGCDKRFDTCKDKFNNVPNFGGFPTIPGPDKVFTTPNAKN